MSDPARDLYSFLRSKEFISSDDEHDTDGAADDEDAPRLRAVDSFDDAPDEGGSESISNADALSFTDDDLGEKLRHADDSAIQNADFGIVRVDDDGVVQEYNRYESEMSGVSPDDAIGKNFFTELAPCSNNNLFRGRFKSGVRKGEMDERFSYTFTYKMRPTLVNTRMYRDDAGNNWIMVQKY